MILSGWAIYDASPFVRLQVSRARSRSAAGSAARSPGTSLPCGCWWPTGSSTSLYGLLSGHFGRRLLPLGPRLVWARSARRVAVRARHRLGAYNAVQRRPMSVALLLGIVLVLSGLSLWKPVQLQPSPLLLGGYEAARRVHFLAMSGLVGFVGVASAARGPGAAALCLPMITGRARAQADGVAVAMITSAPRPPSPWPTSGHRSAARAAGSAARRRFLGCARPC